MSFEKKIKQSTTFLELQYAVLSLIMSDEDFFKSKSDYYFLDKPTLLPKTCPPLSTKAVKRLMFNFRWTTPYS